MGGYSGGVSYGCQGGAIMGGYSGGVSYGCQGGAIMGGGNVGGYPGTVVPSTPVPSTPSNPGKGPEDDLDTAAPATLVVNLPADAKLKVGEQQTTQTSERRVFVSPKLSPGQVYTYNLKAEVVRQGKPISWQETVSVQAGKQTQISMKVPAVSVAGR